MCCKRCLHPRRTTRFSVPGAIGFWLIVFIAKYARSAIINADHIVIRKVKAHQNNTIHRDDSRKRMQVWSSRHVLWCIRAHLRTHLYTCARTRASAEGHTCKQIHTCTHRDEHIHAHTCTHTYAYMHVPVHTCTHLHAERETHTLSHTQEAWVSYRFCNKIKIRGFTSSYNLLLHLTIYEDPSHVRAQDRPTHLRAAPYSIMNALQRARLFLHFCTLRWWLLAISWHKRCCVEPCL